MRVLPHKIVVYGLAAAVCAPPLCAQSKDPAAILASARQAMGGDAKLAAVKSFTATGRTRQVRGDNLVPIEFELFAELPDKYVRKDEVPAQESGPTATGFNGDELLVDPPQVTPPAPPGAAPPNPAALEAARKARVTTLKQDFARLALGMFATSFSSYPLTYTYVGEAEAPQGKADVIDAKGPNNFTLRLFLNQQTHLPIMVSWQGAPAGRGRGPMPAGAAPGGAGPAAGRGAAPAAAASPGERGAPPSAPPATAGPPSGTPAGVAPPAGAPSGAPPAGSPPPSGNPPQASTSQVPGGRGAAPGMPAPVENRLYFADYRETDGLQFPFRLRRAVGPDTIEETTFDRFKINPKIDPRRFENRK
jgi:hypothetical protein